MPECLARTVAWQAPALDTVLLRFDRSQVREIITYGRPGTPMPAWGVKSGKGVLNAQGVNDLINYLASLTLTPEQAKARSAKAVSDFRSSATESVERSCPISWVAGLGRGFSSAKGSIAIAASRPKRKPAYQA